MIKPIDIDKKEFTRDKRGYNSREVDEFLDLIRIDYEKIMSDNRSMAHKIKFLEKQLEESQKSDTSMIETLETAKRLMADISASAERRAELMIRDAELEAENMILEAKSSVKQLSDEHIVLSNKVKRLRANYKRMLTAELEKMDQDEYDILSDLDRSDLAVIDSLRAQEPSVSKSTLVISEPAAPAPSLAAVPVTDPTKATVADLSDSLKKMAQGSGSLEDTIILK